MLGVDDAHTKRIVRDIRCASFCCASTLVSHGEQDHGGFCSVRCGFFLNKERACFHCELVISTWRRKIACFDSCTGCFVVELPV